MEGCKASKDGVHSAVLYYTILHNTKHIGIHIHTHSHGADNHSLSIVCTRTVIQTSSPPLCAGSQVILQSLGQSPKPRTGGGHQLSLDYKLPTTNYQLPDLPTTSYTLYHPPPSWPIDLSFNILTYHTCLPFQASPSIYLSAASAAASNSSPAPSTSVDMAAVDFSKYKRLVQYFWDPEPTNDAASRSPVWCLGKEYRATPKSPAGEATASSLPGCKSISAAGASRPAKPTTPPDSTASSLGSGVHDEDEGGGWPTPFLDDFESKIWLTYRSNFPAIPRSQDPKAASSMSLSVRLRSQLGDQAGFTSDTGWGCMIRSGQSLLANTLVMLRMGRGQ